MYNPAHIDTKGEDRPFQDWPARPDVKAPLSATTAEARHSSAATPPADPRTPTHASAGGAFITLFLIFAAPAALFLGAWFLIELMTRLPLAIIGGLLMMAGVLGWALCRAGDDDWRVEPDCYLDSPLWRFRR